MKPVLRLALRRFVIEKPVLAKNTGSDVWPILVALLLLSSISYFGCGVKSPPVPPTMPPVLPVANLAYQVADQTISLTWRLSKPLAPKQAKNATFGLYRFRTILAEAPCDGCPLVFEKVASVAYADSDANRFSVDIPIENGYRYVFKVRIETDSGVGPDSNPVRLDHLTERPSGASETP